MTPVEELRDSLKSFAQSCNENERLMAMIKEWNRTLHIHATDLDVDTTLITRSGTVTMELGIPKAADLVILSTAEILTQVFYGELTPTEPYNAGTLRIQGSEEDIIRLDFMSAMLWE